MGTDEADKVLEYFVLAEQLTGVRLTLDLLEQACYSTGIVAVSKHAREQGWSWTDPAPTPDELAARDSDIRAWAESRGIGVTERGRIPSNVVGLYDAARLDRPQELKRDHPSEE